MSPIDRSTRNPRGIPRMISRDPSAAPPGSPDTGQTPVLPSLPHGMRAYDPPLTPPLVFNQQAPIRGQALTYEAQSKRHLLTVDENGTFPERSIFTTRQRWRAIDVYLDPTGIQVNPDAFFSVFVYAVGQNSKTLVASGRYGGLPTLDFLQYPGPSWIAAARANVERYEVAVAYNQAPSVVPPTFGALPFTVTCIAADEMTEPCDRVGASVIATEAQASIINRRELGGATWLPKPELLEVWAVNDSAAPRFLLLLEGTGAPVLGEVPEIVWPLGPGAGYGVYERLINLRLPEGFALAASSTAATYTPVEDCVIQAVIR